MKKYLLVAACLALSTSSAFAYPWGDCSQAPANDRAECDFNAGYMALGPAINFAHDALTPATNPTAACDSLKNIASLAASSVTYIDSSLASKLDDAGKAAAKTLSTHASILTSLCSAGGAVDIQTAVATLSAMSPAYNTVYIEIYPQP